MGAGDGIQRSYFSNFVSLILRLISPLSFIFIRLEPPMSLQIEGKGGGGY